MAGIMSVYFSKCAEWTVNYTEDKLFKWSFDYTTEENSKFSPTCEYGLLNYIECIGKTW